MSKFRNSSQPYTAQRLVSLINNSRHTTPTTKNINFSRELAVINWGVSDFGVNSRLLNSNNIIINHPSSITAASNKLKAFNILKEDKEIINYLPEFTTDIEHVKSNFSPKEKWVCRRILSGSSGKGIVIAETPDGLVDAPLYVKYFPKKWEIRVHIIAGEAVIIQQKKKLTQESLEERGIIPEERLVRNLQNGYVYSTILSDDLSNHPTLLNEVVNVCVRAVGGLGLDFGAVDIIINNNFKFKFLEVNTAPGLQGESVAVYATKLSNLIDSRNQ